MLTPPAVATLVGYLLLALTLLLPFDMTGDDGRVVFKYDLAQRLLLLLLLLFPLALGVYSVNCFVVGKCMLLSWVVALFTVVWAVAVILTATLNRTFDLGDVFAIAPDVYTTVPDVTEVTTYATTDVTVLYAK